jgi:hypothetical protein
MNKKFGIRCATAVAVASMSLLGLAGTADAQPGVSNYVGYGQTNNPHAVWCTQHMLNYIFRTDPLQHHGQISEDSAFGPQTDEAIRYEQRMAHLAQVDGIVGPQTGDVLLNYGDPTYGIRFDDQTLTTGYGYCYSLLPSLY